MRIISVRQSPEHTGAAIKYFQEKWASEKTMDVYSDCINHSTGAGALPQWYLMLDEDKIIGCAGLITNDFISRMDLYPWICALYIEKGYRGKSLGSLLLKKAESDAKDGGFSHAYLCTGHIGYYEKYGYEYIGTGFHPWGEASRIYRKAL